MIARVTTADIGIAKDYIRLLENRIEDLMHELKLLRQHTAGCERCQAVEEEDAAKRRADV